MKKIIFCLASLLLHTQMNAQSVGVGTANPDSSAQLDVASTVKGMLVPRMSTAQRNAITSPATGLIVYDNSLNQFYFYNGTAWTAISTGTNYWTLSGSDIYNNNSSNVGIGTSAPASKLSVLTNVPFAAQFDGTDADGTWLGLNNSSGSSYWNLFAGGSANQPGKLLFRDNTTVRMVIQSSDGNVGIGTTSPAAQLHLAGEANDILKLESSSPTGTWLKLQNTSTGGNTFSIISTGIDNGEGSGKLLFNAPSGQMIFTSNGRLGLGQGSPAEKLDVNGKIKTTNFQMTNGATNGYVLTSDAVGSASWAASPTGSSVVTAGTGLSYSGTTLNSVWTTDGSHIASNNTGNVSVGATNDGNITGGALVFGGTGSGEGIASKRTIGGNQFGLDFYTASTNQMSISTSGNIGMGTAAPGSKLDIRSSGIILNMQSSTNEADIRMASPSGTEAAVNYSTNDGGIIKTKWVTGKGDGAETGSNEGSNFIINRYDDNGTYLGRPFEIARNTGQVYVNNKLSTPAFQFLSGAVNGYVLQSDASGNASWVNAGTLNISETDPQVSSSVSGYIPKWNGTTLTDGIIYDDGSNVGIGTSSPTEKLQVNGRIKTTYFQLTDGAGSGLLLKSDANGNASWVGASSAVLAGTGLSYSGSTLNSVWTKTGSDIYNNTTGRTGIGTTAANSKLEVVSTDGNTLTLSSSNTDVTDLYIKNSTVGASTIRWTGPANTNGQQKLLFVTPGSDVTMTLDQFQNRVGIGTVSPATKLDVSGTTRTTQLQVTDGAANGYLLQSDASGNATWTALTSAITAGTGLSWSGNTLNSVWSQSSGDIYRTSGNVGIGTSTMSAKLHVVSASNTVGFMESSATNGTWFTLYNSSTGGTDWHLISTGSSNGEGAGNLLFRGNGNVRMVLQSATGNLGIGTTAPSSRLHVYNNSGNSAVNVQSAANNAYVNLNAGASGMESSIAAFTNGTQRWSFGKSNGAESGSNAGSDFFINRYNDAGTFQSQPVVIKRNTGYVGINQGSPGQQLDVNGNINVSSSGAYYIGNAKVLSVVNTDNTIAGGLAGQSLSGGVENTMMGYAALNSLTNGNHNVAVGYGSGLLNTGSNNTFIGHSAGSASSGSSNIFIGYQAGGSESGDNKLYIENSGSSSPLIYGDFSKDSVAINGSFTIEGAMGLKVKTAQVAGTNNPNATGGIWIYSSGSGTIDLSTAANTDRLLIILNNTGATRTISSYRDLTNTAQTTIANNISLWLVYDGTNWRQIK